MAKKYDKRTKNKNRTINTKTMDSRNCLYLYDVKSYKIHKFILRLFDMLIAQNENSQNKISF